MSSALTVIQTPANTTALQIAPQGGLGLKADSKFFQLKPDTISINQPNTQVEGAIKGHLRLAGGDQYEFLNVVMLDAPLERADYYIGEPGTLYRVQDNLMCFSRDLVKPDRSARSPQSLLCGSCNKSNENHANWEKYSKTKNKADIPGCETTLSVLLLDTKLGIPYRIYLRSSARKAFLTGLQEYARKLQILRKHGLEPNIFDIAFKLSTKASTSGKITNYVPFLSEFRVVTPDEKEEYMEQHLQYTAAARQYAQSVEAEIAQVSDSIDAQVADPSLIHGEIVI